MKNIFLALGLIAFLTGCGSSKRGEPAAGPLDLASAQLIEGRKAFHHHCHECHPGGEAGLGPALNNKPLPGFLIRLQVRKGFGAMPGFSREHLSDRELDDLIAFLKKLRRSG
jgi:mono/diheme cytochrome c family protein